MRLRLLALSLLNLFLLVVEALLALRFVLKLFAANSTVGFVQWVYNMSAPLLQPFRGIFSTTVFQGRYVLELTTIFAMIIYAVLGLILAALIEAVTVPVADDTRTSVFRRRRV